MPLRMLWKTGTCCVTVTEPCELPPSCVDDDDDDDNDDHDNDDDDDEHDDEHDDDDDRCEPSRPLQVFRSGSALEASRGTRGAVWGQFWRRRGPSWGRVGALFWFSSRPLGGLGVPSWGHLRGHRSAKGAGPTVGPPSGCSVNWGRAVSIGACYHPHHHHHRRHLHHYPFLGRCSLLGREVNMFSHRASPTSQGLATGQTRAPGQGNPGQSNVETGQSTGAAARTHGGGLPGAAAISYPRLSRDSHFARVSAICPCHLGLAYVGGRRICNC